MNPNLRPDHSQRPPTANAAPRSARSSDIGQAARRPTSAYSKGSYMSDNASRSSGSSGMSNDLLSKDERVMVNANKKELREEVFAAFSREAARNTSWADVQAVKTVFTKGIVRRDGIDRQKFIACALRELLEDFIEEQEHHEQMQHGQSRSKAGFKEALPIPVSSNAPLSGSSALPPLSSKDRWRVAAVKEEARNASVKAFATVSTQEQYNKASKALFDVLVGELPQSINIIRRAVQELGLECCAHRDLRGLRANTPKPIDSQPRNRSAAPRPLSGRSRSSMSTEVKQQSRHSSPAATAQRQDVRLLAQPAIDKYKNDLRPWVTEQLRQSTHDENIDQIFAKLREKVNYKSPFRREQIIQAIAEVIRECAAEVAGKSNSRQAHKSRQNTPRPLSRLPEAHNVFQKQNSGSSVRSQRSISALPPSRPTSLVQGTKNSSQARSNVSNLPVKEPFEVWKDRYRGEIFSIFEAEERSGGPLLYGSVQRNIFLQDWARGISKELLGHVASDLFQEYERSRHAQPTAWNSDVPLWERATQQIESPNFDFKATVGLLQNDTHRKMSRKAAEDYLDFVLAEMREYGGLKHQNRRFVRVQQGNTRFSKEELSQRPRFGTEPAFRSSRNIPQQPFSRRQGEWLTTKQAKPIKWKVLKEKHRRPPLLWRLTHW